MTDGHVNSQDITTQSPAQVDVIVINEEDSEKVFPSRELCNKPRVGTDETEVSCSALLTKKPHVKEAPPDPPNKDCQLYSQNNGSVQDRAPRADKSQNGSPSQKASKSKRGKKTELPPNISEDQLKLAQSYFVTLERKVNDLEDSNNILKQELKAIE